VNSEGCDLHYVAYVKKVQPFALVKVPQNSFHI
jgi:hypothetical protein